MFSRFRNRFGYPEGEAHEAPPAPPSIISRDLRIVGDVHSDGELQIDGVVEGDVRAGTLLVGDTADIRGDVIAENVHVHGRLAGHISARVVGLGETAHVTGDILHEDISIQMGAYLEGRCKRAPESKRQTPSRAAARTAAARDRAEGGEDGEGGEDEGGEDGEGETDSGARARLAAEGGPALVAGPAAVTEVEEDAPAPARKRAS